MSAFRDQAQAYGIDRITQGLHEVQGQAASTGSHLSLAI